MKNFKLMKKVISVFILFLFVALKATPQILQPALWKVETSVSEISVGDEIEVIFKATIDPNWYLYSSDFDPDLGPMVTTFTFKSNDTYQLVGGIRAIHPKKKYDEIFEGDVTYFKVSGEFRQAIKILKSNPVISGSYTYQVCSDVDGKCIPFDEEFSVGNIKVKMPDSEGDTKISVNTFDGSFQTLDAVNDKAGDGILIPATWSYSVEGSALPGKEVGLVFKAAIDPDWVLYSSDFKLDPGPIPASFVFDENETYKLMGQVRPVGAKEKYDEIFEGKVRYFKKHAAFRQTIKILKKDFSVKGTLEYQVCSDVDGKCIPFEEDFQFGKNKLSAAVAGVKENTKHKGILRSRDSHDPYSLLAFMIIAFLGGLAALFTPCVFPMIPMTVSFFTGRAKNRKEGVRNAIFYGFSIVLIYTLAGSLVAPFMGAEMANELATNWLPNILFSAIFLVFALSFLGLFEITLPSSWVNKVDKQADKGGFGGIFFMAFALVLVSFSCTGPIVGSILVESAGGQFLKPILGMFAFSLAFAVPFTLFAIFPEWLNSLPKSGGWLNSIKVVLGFIELAFALKFLSIADQAYHWHLLDREIYLALWIVIFSFIGLYFLGKIRLPHDSKMESVPVLRLILAIITFTFVVYMVPGMFGAPLKALAGYLPPMSTHDFDLPDIISSSGAYQSDDNNVLCENPKYADFLHLPHGIEGYFDYDQAIACAKEKNKPVFVDFTGHGCVNCREMEARVWSDKEVLKRLKNDYIVLALYVDDKTDLPESSWYTSDYDGKIKKSLGKQNADRQIREFQNNAQPFYILLDPITEKPLVEQKAYDLNVQSFINFLNGGVQKYESKYGK